MHLLKRYILLAVWAMMAVCGVVAQDVVPAAKDTVANDVPNVEVSMITCTDGDDIYTKFGHTAIRVYIDDMHDWAFNYGCFNYNSENFIWRFVLGQTDYLLTVEPMRLFVERYRSMGIGVSEQRLNLTQEESLKLLTLLEDNIQPENQQYRYSWLYDNCTERARDMVERAIDGMVDYERKEDESITVRDILHYCLRDVEWMDWGISVILGSEIDVPTDKRLQMFIPNIYRMELNEANIIRVSTGKQPMVTEEVEILAPYASRTNGQHNVQDDAKQQPLGGWGASGYFSTPSLVFALLLVVVVAITVWDIKRKRQSVWIDVALTMMQGLAGCLIAFLFFFSEHPAVDSNWLVIAFNPIPLGYAAWIVYCYKKKRRNIIAVANVTVLTAFLPTMVLCMQTFCPATYMVVLVLLVRSIAQMNLCR